MERHTVVLACCVIVMVLIGKSLENNENNVKSKPEMSVKQIAKICVKLHTLILERPRFIPEWIRASFHVCVGACDGCVNPEDRGNRGLEEIFNRFIQFYNDEKIALYGLSFADAYALAGIVAMVVAGRSEVPYIHFRYGRTDCDTAPFYDRDLNFPSPNGNFTQTTKWFYDEFGFNFKEVVTILGCHSVGKAHPDISGWDGPWVMPEDVHFLNNGYYKGLLDATFNEFYVQRDVSDPAGRRRIWQWQEPKGLTEKDLPAQCPGEGLQVFPKDTEFETPMFFNSDMICVREITAIRGGESANCKCDPRNCKFTPTAPIVKEFADDNQLWLRELGRTFEKMIENKNTGLKELIPFESKLRGEGLERKWIDYLNVPVIRKKYYSPYAHLGGKNQGNFWIHFDKLARNHG